MKRIWEKSKDEHSRPKYWLTEEFSPDWWGKLELKDGRWHFSYGERKEGGESFKVEKSWKNLNTAKQNAKSYLDTYLFLDGWSEVIKNI